jgi:hypothetical protein
MRFTNGWTKHWRALDDGGHWVGRNIFAYAIFTRLVSWANWEPTKVLRNGQLIIIPRGSLVTSPQEIANSFCDDGCDRRTVDRYLNLFEKDKMIVQQVSNRGRIITICNYDKYQQTENVSVQQNVQQDVQQHVQLVSNSLPRIEELKNLKNEKKLKKGVPKDSRESLGSAIWDRYAQNMIMLYGCAPPRNAKTNSLCKKFGEYIGQNAVEIVDVFFQVPSDYYKSRTHSLDVMIQDHAKLAIAYQQKMGIPKHADNSR